MDFTEEEFVVNGSPVPLLIGTYYLMLLQSLRSVTRRQFDRHNITDLTFYLILISYLCVLVPINISITPNHEIVLTKH